MRLVVADTGPLNYLVLIGEIDLLPKLFEKVLAPEAVRDELTSRKAPESIRAWLAQLPAWLEFHPDPMRDNTGETSLLDRGEQPAIALALSVQADLVLMDDQDGVMAARQRGLRVTGTMGVLVLASERGLIDLTAAFTRLKGTNFRYPPEVMDNLLAQYKTKR